MSFEKDLEQKFVSKFSNRKFDNYNILFNEIWYFIKDDILSKLEPKDEQVEELDDSKILVKAINKAIANGYKYPLTRWQPDELIQKDRKMPAIIHWIIFSHSFAKAFWGEDIVDTHLTFGDYKKELPRWQYHLQRMVLEENPIKYLEKFL